MERYRLLAAALLSVCTLVFSPGGLFAQPGGPPRGPGGQFGGPGGFFGGGGLLTLAQREEVQQELQLIDEQRDKLDDVVTESRERIADEMREMFAGMQDLSNEERQARFEEIRTKFEKLNKEAEGDLKKALLPHQFDRLKQINVQMQIQQRGADALTSGELAEAIDLTDEQQEKLQERAAEVQQELQEKIAKLRLEARNKLLDVLTPEQRAKLQSLTGDGFALPDGGFGPGGVQFRGAGGRGGFFGGGQREGDRRQQRNNNGTN
jgi:Spy/CpxP family protein refolding chaperone